jgi:sphingomyelin phosphodiesterase acid-like 3
MTPVFARRFGFPVAINDDNTVKDTGSGPVEFWEPRYTRQFVDLLLNYRQSVQFVFSGHTHMDDFRVIGNGQLPVVVNKLVPSISPIFRNNLGFQIYEYDRMSGIVLNYHTYYLSNLSRRNCDRAEKLGMEIAI